MTQYNNVLSTVCQPSVWKDDNYTYVLISQEETPITKNPDGTNIMGYKFSYVQFTHQEYEEHLVSQTQLATQIDQSLNSVKLRKIQESKRLLNEYHTTHPLFSIVHNPKGEYYTVTSEKQNYLMYMLSLVEQAKVTKTEFTPVWNATGQSSENWTEGELQTLSLQIADYVRPTIAKQQSYEVQINSLKSVEEVDALEITYED